MADFSNPVVQTTKNSKSALKLGIVVVLTVILAGVAVFTAVRLYQLRNQAVAPTAPTSKPAAQVANLTPPSSTPVATPTLSPSPTSSASATPTVSATPSVSPTAKASAPPIPESGVSVPTMLGIGVGILAIVLSIALAF